MERYRLVKGFGRQEYREEFLDGRLYMNSLGYFGVTETKPRGTPPKV